MKTETAAAPVTLDQFGDVLTRADVMRVFQFPSLNSLYRRLQASRFPAPAMARPMRWFRRDLEAWMAGTSRPQLSRRRA